MVLKFLKNTFMKSTFKKITLVFAFCIPSILFAQNSFFNLRLLAGANFTQIDGDSYGGFNKLGGQLGLGVETRLKRGKSFNFALDATLTQKGSRFISRDDQGQVLQEYTMALIMAEVPVLINYHFSKFFIEAGPAVSFMLSAKEKDANGELPGRADFNFIEISGNIGFGVSINKRNSFTARFSKSISPVRTSPVNQKYTVASGEFSKALHIIYRHHF